MKPVLIVENSTNSLVRESVNGKKDYVMNGIFTEFNVVNRNERVYTANKFLPALNELNDRINNLGAVYGEFDHPDVFDTSLSRASHIINKAVYIPEQNLVSGEIKLLSTYWGKEAKALVDDGCPVFVSSRAAGVTESDGSVSLTKLFTYDIVADPGFASAKMNIKVLNESMGFNTNQNNFRIYEMSDESKINELFNMNKDEFVTKKQLSDYSNYLTTEIAKTKNQVKSAINEGRMEPAQLDKLIGYYEELNSSNSQVTKYLDYLADKIQIVVNENITLKSTTNKLSKHNDYLAETLEKSINYQEYIAEKLDKNISYGEYIAEKVDKNISYGEYIAEKLNNNIKYSEYIAEKVDSNIIYSEYIAEKLDKNISYGEYIAEHLSNSIDYVEYIAENVETNIEYSEYIAENLDDSIEYADYIAEKVDSSISYQGLIVEKLNKKGKSSKVNEHYWFDADDQLPTPKEAGFETQNEYEYEEENEEPTFNYNTEDQLEPEEDCHTCDETEDYTITDYQNEINGESDSELSESIDNLIKEAKKRKVSETSDLNFIKFLNKSQVDSFYALSDNEQDSVKLHISERSYFSGKDVLKLIAEALSTKNESLDEKIIRMMPESVKPLWNELTENSKKSIMSQARLYPEEVLRTDEQIEHFWSTRKIKTNESTTKKLISHDSLIQEDKLSDNEMNLIMERFRSI